jgi:hypothetical protein
LSNWFFSTPFFDPDMLSYINTELILITQDKSNSIAKLLNVLKSVSSSNNLTSYGTTIVIPVFVLSIAQSYFVRNQQEPLGLPSPEGVIVFLTQGTN